MNSTRRESPAGAAPARRHPEPIYTSALRDQVKHAGAQKAQWRTERVNELPRARQRMVSEVLDSLLAQAR